MAWSRTELSAADLAAMAADKPLFVGTNCLRDPSAVEWRTGGSFAAGSDGTDSDYPTSQAYDGFAHGLDTRPSSANDPWYLICDFGEARDFDTVAIIGHNLDGTAVAAQVADDNAFATNLQTVASWAPTASDPTRLVSAALDHSGSSSFKYSAQYFRLYINPTGALVPRISELIVGRRRQLQWTANDPYDPALYRTRGDSFRSKSGVMTFAARSVKQRLLDANYTITSGYITTVASLFELDTDGGQHPFLYIPAPSSAVNTAYLMRFAGGDVIDHGLPYDGPVTRAWGLSAEEVPTYRSDE